MRLLPDISSKNVSYLIFGLLAACILPAFALRNVRALWLEDGSPVITPASTRTDEGILAETFGESFPNGALQDNLYKVF